MCVLLLTVDCCRMIFFTYLVGAKNGIYTSMATSVRFCSKFPHVSYDYTISNMPIKCVESYRDLGITMSSNLQWRDHTNYISSRAYRMLGLIRRCFSSDLDPTTKLSLYISLVHSQLTYCSQIWRPHLLKDISSLERI